MLEVATKAFGTVEINDGDIIDFPEGLLGFQDYRKFTLISDNVESPFRWLQSMDEPSLAFIVIQPEVFMKSVYSPDLLIGDMEALHVEKASECEIYLIVTIPENEPRKMTANLQGPVLINGEKKIGRQVISLNDKHFVRVPILEQMEG